MASLTAVNMYLCANGLLMLAALLLTIARASNVKLRHGIAYRQQLKLGYALTALALLLPIIGAASSNKEFFPQTAQVWSAPTMHVDNEQATDNHRIAIPLTANGASLPLQIAGRVAATLFLAGLFIFLTRIAFDAMAIAQVIGNAQTVRRHGALTILVSDRIQVPFSLWVPTRHFIVIPSALLLRSGDFRIALRHEAQHHRQLDTKLLYFYQLLKAMFFWNPAMHVLDKQIRELQEFACDESVMGQRKISAQAYCHCLLWVAERAAAANPNLLCASMSGSDAGKVLARRIKASLSQPRHLHKSAVIAISGIALALMIVTAFAFSAAIHDQRISAAEADRMATITRQNSRFPIVVNDRVVEQLNLLLGTPDGRTYLQASLKRMETYQALIASHIAQYGLPSELLAIPLVESGYRNLAQDAAEKHGAGLWMFIKTTAKHFGLNVDAHNDERLDVAAETNAAMRLLGSLHKHYGDWGLALLAYNMGSNQVDKAIHETGSRDAWEITRQGYENDPNYLPRVMAAVLIIRNASAPN